MKRRSQAGGKLSDGDVFGLVTGCLFFSAEWRESALTIGDSGTVDLGLARRAWADPDVRRRVYAKAEERNRGEPWAARQFGDG